jgi:hypothetical protein
LPLFHRTDFVITVDVVLIEILEEWRPYALCGPAERCPTPDRGIDLLTTNLGVRSSNLFGRASYFNPYAERTVLKKKLERCLER